MFLAGIWISCCLPWKIGSPKILLLPIFGTQFLNTCWDTAYTGNSLESVYWSYLNPTILMLKDKKAQNQVCQYKYIILYLITPYYANCDIPSGMLLS